MTDGSSQGLFVIVAVVIFGIFVLISYVLFRDNLKVSLASIFEDSISESQNQLTKGKKIPNDITEIVGLSSIDYDSIKIRVDEERIEKEWAYSTPMQQRNLHLYKHKLSDNLIIPWGYSIRISFDIVSKYDTTISYDYNASYTLDGKEVGNDIYSDPILGDGGTSSYSSSKVQKDKKQRITVGFTNGNSASTKNPNKLPVRHYSSMLVIDTLNPEIKEIHMDVSNFHYEIFKDKGVK